MHGEILKGVVIDGRIRIHCLCFTYTAVFTVSLECEMKLCFTLPLILIPLPPQFSTYSFSLLLLRDQPSAVIHINIYHPPLQSNAPPCASYRLSISSVS